MSHRSRLSKGQSLVLMALSLPVLMGVVALAVDVADLYLNWYAIQTGADSSVLSGAAFLPMNPSKAVSTANNYASLNGINASEIVSTAVSNSNTKLTMTVTRDVPFYLAAVLGVPKGTVNAKAAAEVSNVGGNRNGLRPFGLPYADYAFGQIISLKGDKMGPGNWQALALGVSGANAYENNIKFGYSGPEIKIGDLIPTQTGVMQGPTQQAINWVINQQQTYYPSDSPGTSAADAGQNITPGDPRAMLVPLVDFSGANGNSQVPVVAFGEVWVDNIDGRGDLTASFVKAASGSTPESIAPTTGAFAISLVE